MHHVYIMAGGIAYHLAPLPEEDRRPLLAIGAFAVGLMLLERVHAVPKTGD